MHYEFLNAQTQEVIRCVANKAPDSGQIEKIVTVESQGGAYLVSDYYGDMNYISIRQPMDNYQSFPYADGTDSHCEVMQIGNQLTGTYKLYVNDYTSFANGNYDTNAMTGSKVTVPAKVKWHIREVTVGFLQKIAPKKDRLLP